MIRACLTMKKTEKNKVLIIDDESKARVLIKTIIQEYCPEEEGDLS